MFAVPEDQAGGLADLERQLRRNHFVGPAANAVGAEIATNHEMPLDAPFGLVPCDLWFIGGRPCLTRKAYNRANAVILLQKL